MLKRILSLFLASVLLLSLTFMPSFAAEAQNIQQAKDLKQLGLLLDVNGDFALNEKVTRAQGAIMLVRLLGKADEAITQNYTHPFNDVPSWASPYVGYCYKYGLTSGVSKTAYGTTQNMTAEQYVTFVLRSLGYNDRNGDFTLPTSFQLATKINLLSPEEGKKLLSSSSFIRNDLALISYNSMITLLKDSEKLMVEKLLNEGAITEESLAKTQLLVYERKDGTEYSVLNNKWNNSVFYKQGWLHFYDWSKPYGMFKTRLNGTGKQYYNYNTKILDIQGNYIYGLDYIDKSGKVQKDVFCRFTLDGKLDKVYDNKVHSFLFIEDWIYYTLPYNINGNSSHNLWRMKQDGSGNELVIDGLVQDMLFVDNSIYFNGWNLKSYPVPDSIGNALYKFDINTNQIIQLDPCIGGFPYQVQKYKDYIYYEIVEYTSNGIINNLSRIEDNGANKLFKMPVQKDRAYNLIIANEKLYYIDSDESNNGFLYSCNLADGSNETKISDINVMTLDFFGDYLYFYNLKNVSDIYRLNYITNSPVEKLASNGWK